jgi:catechol 2,3-dioxygenase-like lactoylglutathione lyase family enzyme
VKRLHVHVSVSDLDQSVRFYSTLFAVEPTVVKPDYAKWMLEDPRVNFAISTRDPVAGFNHIGLQVDSAEELRQLEAQLKRADRELVSESGITCCYAKGDKYWVTDPQGVAWEVFHTLEVAPMYGEHWPIANLHVPREPACCTSSAKTVGPKTEGRCCY